MAAATIVFLLGMVAPCSHWELRPVAFFHKRLNWIIQLILSHHSLTCIASVTRLFSVWTFRNWLPAASGAPASEPEGR